MPNLPDFSDGYFRTWANSQILPAEGELSSKILELAQDRIAKAEINIGNDRATWDLHPFFSILVSSGWNKNTDVFDNKELWRARHSPKNKPVNLMHSQSDIVGHIIDNIVVGEDLKPIPDHTDEKDLPYTLHVITASVLYKIWELPKKQAEINKLIASIDSGKNFVSMECLFKSFDYALVNKSTGDQRLLERNDKTSSITKHLRQYGGNGTYQNYAIGRLLRDLTFSAQGIVDNPANPESIISPDLNIFNNSNATFSKSVYINLDQLNRESTMAEKTQAKTDWDTGGPGHNYESEETEKNPLKKELASLRGKYDSLKSEYDSLHAKFVDKSLAEKDEEVEDLKKKKVEAEKGKEEAEAAKDEMDKDCKAAKAALETVKSELDAEKATREAYEAASRKSDRTQALLIADKTLNKSQAEAMVEKFKDLHDITFAAMVETLKSYAEKAPKSVTADKLLSTAKVEEIGTTNLPVEDTAKAFFTQVKNAFSKGVK